MEPMFAEIAVDTYQDPTKKLFTYKVPEKLARRAKLGTKVLVPFGKRSVEGYIFELTRVRPPFPTKELKEVKGPALTPAQVKLARWMSHYYAAPPLDCLKCQLLGRGQRYSEGKGNEIETLLLVPYTTKVRVKALELSHDERKTTLIGSRSAIFAPLPNLKRIIIEEPENWIYKDERSPYYHTKNVAQKRAELEGLKLELRYLLPRVEDLPTSPSLPADKAGKTRRVWGSQPDGLRNRRVEIIDLKKERGAGNFSRLSTKVAKVFRQTNPPGSFLAFVNSREAKKDLRQAIKAENLDMNRIEIAGAEIFGQIGKEYAMAVMIDTDTLLNLPDFRSHEKLLLTITKLGQLTKGAIFLQTTNIGHPLFEELRTEDLESFYRRELEARKPLLYPPFGVLTKLEFSAKTTAKVEAEARKLYEKLAHDSRLTTHDLFVSPPYPPYSKTRGKAQLNIAVKTRSRQLLNKILSRVPPTWRIIVDPESLL